MKLFYAVIIVMVVFISACAQQTGEQPPVVSPEPAVEEPEAPEPEIPVEVPEDEEEEVAPAVGGEVRILGKEGFEPMELTISAGSAVTWINDDSKDLIFTMFKDGKWYINSDVTKPGGKFENEFTEAGEYEYWTLAYGVKAKVIVE